MRNRVDDKAPCPPQIACCAFAGGSLVVFVVEVACLTVEIFYDTVSGKRFLK
jgi:hypothetical protein